MRRNVVHTGLEARESARQIMHRIATRIAQGDAQGIAQGIARGLARTVWPVAHHVALVCLGFFGACVDVEPPIGQFACATADDCPDDWICGGDSRCYPSPLACYPHAQIGCGPGQGCYTTNSGPVCVLAGPLPEYTRGCDGTNESLRCVPGTVCVSFSEGIADNVCLHYCRSDADCRGAQCAGSLIVSEESARLLGDELLVCTLCSNTCRYARDGECDDGRAGAVTSLCDFGTDCADCGIGLPGGG